MKLVTRGPVRTLGDLKSSKEDPAVKFKKRLQREVDRIPAVEEKIAFLTQQVEACTSPEELKKLKRQLTRQKRKLRECNNSKKLLEETF